MPNVKADVQVQRAARIPKARHRALMLHCVNADKPLMELVVEALQQRLAKTAGRKRPGRVTR